MERAGGELVAAVEKSEMAARTYYHNYVGDASDARFWNAHTALSLREQADAKVIAKELSAVLADTSVMSRFASQTIDAVVGGPPCQGFSMAGRRNKDDLRNRLAWEYLEFVEAVQPKVVVIENVVGMSRSFTAGEESSFSQLQKALGTLGRGYQVQAVQVNAMHYGAPQNRPRLMLIALRQDVADVLNIVAGPDIWRSNFSNTLDKAPLPRLAPKPTVSEGKSFSIRDSISDLPGWENDKKGRNEEYRQALALAESVVNNGNPRKSRLPNQTYRKHSDRVVKRFSFYRLLLDSSLDQRLFSALAANPSKPKEISQKWLETIRTPITLQVSNNPVKYQSIESLSDLVSLAVDISTKKHSQKALSADLPARTVVTLPDDYVHPKASRIFTVRELARFQGFPDNFEFVGKETTGSTRRKVEVPQYTQVGNAVSPWQSQAVGVLIKNLLDEYEFKYQNDTESTITD